MASEELIRAVKSYDGYAELHGITEELIKNYYIPAIKTAILSEKDIEYGLALAKRAKDMLEGICKEQTGGDMMALDSYCNHHGVSAGILDSYYAILDMEGPHLFDSYMLALERNRKEEDRFYSPKRNVLRGHGLIQAMQDLEDDLLDILTISMCPGSGKGSCLYSKVLTPDGFVEMRDIKVGSKVISGTGNVCTVLGVFPQGKKDCYELTFDDGSKCRCSNDHLWRVQTRYDRRRNQRDGSEKYRVVELQSMLKDLKVENGKRYNYSIDYVGKIDFGEKELPIHPYLLGVLIGDGCLREDGVEITIGDKELIPDINRLLPDGYEAKRVDRYDYRVTGSSKIDGRNRSLVKEQLRELGLLGKRSYEKFIPNIYMLGSFKQRIELLRGLMDTDGHAEKCYGEYYTSSEQLAKDVVELAHSLGFYASLRRKGAGYKKDGEYRKCRDVYKILIQTVKDAPSIFKLERKRKKFRPRRTRMRRFLTNVEYIGKEECQCIYISDPSHLYVTDDYIITHNTTLEKFFASWIIGRHPSDYSLFYSHSDDITRMFYDGVLDITTNADEYRWGEIFPDVKFKKADAKRQQINFDKAKPFANLQCTSTGASNAGKVRCNRYLYCDDLISKQEEALNKKFLDKLWNNNYSVDAKQRKEDGCKEIHIATRWSIHDVIGRLQRLYPGDKRMKSITVRATDEVTGESNFNYKYKGMSKEFFRDQQLAMDEVSYNALYNGVTVERDGLLYSDDELRRYSELPEREPDAILGICDVKNKGTDYMFLPAMYQYGEDYYCVDCVCDNTSNYEIQYAKLTNVILENNMQKCEFESNNGGDRVSHEVRKRVENADGRCHITEKATETNKETRIEVNSYWVKKHVLFKDKNLYTKKSDYGIMMDWLMMYSVGGKNEHDDVPDGFANFALFATKKTASKKVRIYRGIL